MFDLARMQRAAQSKQPLADPAGAVAVAPAVEFTDTVIFQSPVIRSDPAVLEQSRILPPGAGGPHGAPYKLLRTQVLKRLDHLKVNTLAVISPCSADGKTVTAINLAIAIAAGGDRTALLVDLDLRNPTIHKRFGFEPEVGLEECLQERRPVQEAMVKIAGYDRLTVLPTRHRIEQSSELLGVQRTIEVVGEMRMRYANRIVIFDLPPVLLADDALAFSHEMQAALLVVGEGRTRREDVARTLELLHDTPVIGTALNGSREKSRTYY